MLSSYRDVLLLEAGFLTILVAPLNFFGLLDGVWHHSHDHVNLWLVRWLLFRLTFASGVVKLTSNSDTWWSLTGGLFACMRAGRSSVCKWAGGLVFLYATTCSLGGWPACGWARMVCVCMGRHLISGYCNTYESAICYERGLHAYVLSIAFRCTGVCMNGNNRRPGGRHWLVSDARGDRLVCEQQQWRRQGQGFGGSGRRGSLSTPFGK